MDGILLFFRARLDHDLLFRFVDEDLDPGRIRRFPEADFVQVKPISADGEGWLPGVCKEFLTRYLIAGVGETVIFNELILFARYRVDAFVFTTDSTGIFIKAHLQPHPL